MLAGAKLRLTKYSPAYRQRLLDSGTAFCRFLLERGISTKLVASGSKQLLDETLEHFVNELHDAKTRSKGALQLAKHAILFVQVLRPRLRCQLKASWASIKAWEEQEPSQLRSPLPLPILIGMMCLARVHASQTQGADRQKLLVFSALLGLGYFALLRPGELLALTPNDLSLPNQLTFGAPCVTVTLKKPKNFRQLGYSQFAVVYQPDICNWITWLCMTTCDPMKPLWPHSGAEFRRLFKHVGKKLLGGNHSFTPASLRAGGTTLMFDLVGDINRLRLMGRWSSAQSLEHYVQTAKAQQILLTIRPRGVRTLSQLVSHGHFLLSLPAHLAQHLPSECLLCHGQQWFESIGPIWQKCRKWGSFVEKV